MPYSLTNSKQLREAMKKLEGFGGVHARDAFFLYPGYDKTSFIINTDSISLPGKHWIAVKIDGNDAYYFDPMAYSPAIPSVVKQLGIINKKVWYCMKRTQSIDSTTCGQHCVYFLFHDKPAATDKEAINFFLKLQA